MKNVWVNYEAKMKEGGQWITGEAGLALPMADETADTLIREYGKPGVFLMAAEYVEAVLTMVEKLRGRMYVPGSIKEFQLMIGELQGVGE